MAIEESKLNAFMGNFQDLGAVMHAATSAAGLPISGLRMRSRQNSYGGESWLD